ncbi:hypothetical protein N007_00760 [Alicyclobacillus acidoterrestris ATCC 49025]|nr:hypothetical protein N007_00760 [Alicyclobacillus acidoterrestris ATCC 49025]
MGGLGWRTSLLAGGGAVVGIVGIVQDFYLICAIAGDYTRLRHVKYLIYLKSAR